MNSMIHRLAAGSLLMLALPLWACDDMAGRQPADASGQLLDRAVAQLRAEQAAGLQNGAQTALARLHSDVATAVAQGAGAGHGSGVKTQP